MIKNIFSIIAMIILFAGCFGSDVNFMGADKYIGGGTFVERWYLKPEYKKENIPKGSGFYGASVQKIKDRFEIKYYKKTKDGEDDILIPKNDLWTIKHNGKDWHTQDDEKLFYYVKRLNKYVRKMDVYNKKRDRYDVINNDEKLLAVETCYQDGWCKLYPDVYEKEYIYKTINIR